MQIEIKGVSVRITDSFILGLNDAITNNGDIFTYEDIEYTKQEAEFILQGLTTYNTKTLEAQISEKRAELEQTTSDISSQQFDRLKELCVKAELEWIRVNEIRDNQTLISRYSIIDNQAQIYFVTLEDLYLKLFNEAPNTLGEDLAIAVISLMFPEDVKK